VQQHENLQLIAASQVDQLWQHVVTHSNPVLTRISKPLWLNIRTTGAEVAGADNFMLHQWRKPSLCGRWSQVARPRPRQRLEGSKTKTKTKTLRFQDQDRDRDSRVSRPRLERKDKLDTGW